MSKEHLIPFQKGKSGNPKGRPRKWVTTMSKHGYKQSEINDCIQVMLAMTLEELKMAFENPTATVLEKTVAAALKKSIEKGSLYSIETLLTRVYGKPTETANVNMSQQVTGKVTITTVSTGVPLAYRESDVIDYEMVKDNEQT